MLAKELSQTAENWPQIRMKISIKRLQDWEQRMVIYLTPLLQILTSSQLFPLTPKGLLISVA